MAQINLTTTKPVKLKTQEKYCEEDIEIIPNLQEKTIKPTIESQEVLVDEGYSGINKLTVDPINVGSKTFTENGEYYASDSGIDGWNKITIDVGGSAEVELLLPESFTPATNIYWFKLNDSQLLISAYNLNVGLWLYDLNTQTAEQVYDVGGSYNQFKMIDDYVLFCSYSSSFDGLYLYNINTKEVAIIDDKSYGYLYSDFVNIGDNRFLYLANRYLGVYDHNLKAVTLTEYVNESYFSSGYVEGYTQIGNDYITKNKNYNPSTYIYMSATNSFKKCEYKLYTVDDTSIRKVGDNYFIDPTQVGGLFLYNTSDYSITKLYSYSVSGTHKYIDFADKTLINIGNYIGVFNHNDLSYSDIFNDLGTTVYMGKCGENKALITSANYQGIRIYRSTDNTYTQLSTTGYYNTIIPAKKGCLYLGSNSSYKGLFYVDEETETITEKLANVISSYFKVLYQNPFGIFLANTSSEINGIYLFNEDTAELTQKYDQSYGYGNTSGPNCPTPNGILSFASNGLIVYIDNNSADVVEVFKSTNGYNLLALIDGDKYYFGNYSNYGVCVVDLSTMTGEQLYSTGYRMTVAQKTQSGIYFICDYKTSSTDTAGILYYDYNTCEQIYNQGYYDVIKEINADEVVIENSVTNTTTSTYKYKVKFKPSTREKQVYYKIGEI